MASQLAGSVTSPSIGSRDSLATGAGRPCATGFQGCDAADEDDALLSACS